MAFAFLFPGQGSQSLHMMDGFATLPVVKHTFEEASEVLSTDLWEMLQQASADEINATVNTQPLMLTAGVAVYRAWLNQGGAVPAQVAGHSLGEYSALVAAEALAFDRAVWLVRERALAMQNAVPAEQGAMAAILGLQDLEVVEACAVAANGEVVQAVNFNSPGQIVIAGDVAAVERAMILCKEKGAKRALRLPVSVPSHCALMKPAAMQLAEALKQVNLVLPKIPVIHNADVVSYQDSLLIRDALVRQLYSPVRWTETIQKLVNDGTGNMAECGPGKVLAGLAKRINAEAKCIAITDLASLEQALAELA